MRLIYSGMLHNPNGHSADYFRAKFARGIYQWDKMGAVGFNVRTVDGGLMLEVWGTRRAWASDLVVREIVCERVAIES